ncbi:MAG TPA: glycoside hydrolase family 15 protein [Acidimicrobiia bacterium]|nr:glycoside hydrolase family 15 protein [Acidimicrobiia bacterium]
MNSTREIPIGDYGLIGDTRTAALVAPDGSIDWLCLPRFDSPPIFGRLVGGPEAGHFAIGPDEPAQPAGRRYRGDTATLETEWALDGGRLLLTDSMVAEVSGSMLPETMLVRRITSRGRPIRVNVDVVPRFGYDRRPSRGSRSQHGSLLIDHGDIALAVTTNDPQQLTPERPTVIEVPPGQPVTVVMSAAHRSPRFLVPPSVAAKEAVRDEIRWQQWADTLITGPHHRQAMVRSLITLQLLTYSPSGAPVAAPTTSLPEAIGYSRNWDYRYAWPRDASMGIAAFLTAGKKQEALGFLAWLLHASRLDRPWLPALFSLDGRRPPGEQTLADWPGYADSRPVRVGNEARKQHQLDGYGWVLDSAWQLTQTGPRLDSETWRTLRVFTDHVSRTWMLPDAGIWERRDQPRHHIHSKLMAWVALDRAMRIAKKRGATSHRQLTKWRTAAKSLGEEIRGRGFDQETGAYTAAFGSKDLDAALLLLPWTGFESPGSPRATGTVDAIRNELGAGGPLIYRYRDHDGLTGDEGAFLPCSFWLVHALAETGRRSDAETLFEELLDLSNGLGLYAEEMDPSSHQHLGNYPQALTHSALLQAASALES